MPLRQIEAALIFTPQPVITTALNTGHQELTFYPAACSFQSFYYIFYMDSTAPPTIYFQSSSDGITWAAPVAIQALTNAPNTGFSLLGQTAMSCNGLTGQFAFAWVDNFAGAGKWHVDWRICTLGSGAILCSAAQQQGPISSNGHLINLATGSGVVSIRQLGGTTYYGVVNSGVGREIAVNNVDQLNTTTLQAGGFDFGQTSTGGLNIAVASSVGAAGTQLTYAYSTDGATWSCCTTISSLNGGTITYGVGVTGLSTGGPSSGIMGSGGTVYIAYTETHSGGNCLTTSCLEMAKVNIAGTLARVTIGDVVATQPALITGDGGQNFELIVHSGSTSASSLAQSTDGAVTWSISNFIGAGSIGSGGTINQQGLSPYWSATLDAFVLVSASSAAPFNVYAQVFALSNQGQTGSTTLGSCPSKNTATTTLANSTQYFYTGTAMAAETILNMEAEIASVNSGHAASETVYFALYSTPQPGAISVGNPFFLDNVKTWTLSATSAPQLLNWAPGGNLFGPNVPAGATIGISIIGNSKIVVNQSSLAGMFTGTSGSIVGTTGTPQSTFTALTANAAQLFFCANLNFQNIFTTTTTVTTTVTSLSTTTVGTAGTSTTTVTSLDQNAALTSSVNYVLVIFMVLGPAVILSSIGAVLTRSAALTGSLFIAGMTVGAGAGNLSGIVPFNILALVVVLIVFLIIGLIMIMRSGSPGS